MVAESHFGGGSAVLPGGICVLQTGCVGEEARWVNCDLIFGGGAFLGGVRAGGFVVQLVCGTIYRSNYFGADGAGGMVSDVGTDFHHYVFAGDGIAVDLAWTAECESVNYGEVWARVAVARVGVCGDGRCGEDCRQRPQGWAELVGDYLFAAYDWGALFEPGGVELGDEAFAAAVGRANDGSVVFGGVAWECDRRFDRGKVRREIADSNAPAVLVHRARAGGCWMRVDCFCAVYSAKTG